MSTIKVDTITDEAGTCAPDFPQGMTGDGSSLTGLATAAQGALASTALQPNGDGSGLTGVGASTSFGAVGTYVFGHTYASSIDENTTIAGSSLNPAGIVIRSFADQGVDNPVNGGLVRNAEVFSGTWRSMGRANGFADVANRATVFVRIS